jgi:uncharacterized protein HemX
MELDKIQLLLDKYFEGNSTTKEEDSLSSYFSSEVVDASLEHYKPLFDYYAAAKETKSAQNTLQIPVVKTKKRTTTWISIAASVAVLIGTGTYAFLQLNNNSKAEDLGTYDDPELAYKETQKALTMLSNQVNVGIEGVQHLQEFDKSKNKIFNLLIKN